jgi:hypothetical protein
MTFAVLRLSVLIFFTALAQRSLTAQSSVRGRDPYVEVTMSAGAKSQVSAAPTVSALAAGTSFTISKSLCEL